MAHISIKDLSVEFAIFGANARSLKNTVLAQATGGRVMAGARDIVGGRFNQLKASAAWPADTRNGRLLRPWS